MSKFQDTICTIIFFSICVHLSSHAAEIRFPINDTCRTFLEGLSKERRDFWDAQVAHLEVLAGHASDRGIQFKFRRDGPIPFMVYSTKGSHVLNRTAHRLFNSFEGLTLGSQPGFSLALNLPQISPSYRQGNDPHQQMGFLPDVFADSETDDHADVLNFGPKHFIGLTDDMVLQFDADAPSFQHELGHANHYIQRKSKRLGDELNLSVWLSPPLRAILQEQALTTEELLNRFEDIGRSLKFLDGIDAEKAFPLANKSFRAAETQRPQNAEEALSHLYVQLHQASQYAITLLEALNNFNVRGGTRLQTELGFARISTGLDFEMTQLISDQPTKRISGDALILLPETNADTSDRAVLKTIHRAQKFAVGVGNFAQGAMIFLNEIFIGIKPPDNFETFIEVLRKFTRPQLLYTDDNAFKHEDFEKEFNQMQLRRTP